MSELMNLRTVKAVMKNMNFELSDFQTYEKETLKINPCYSERQMGVFWGNIEQFVNLPPKNRKYYIIFRDKKPYEVRGWGHF